MSEGESMPCPRCGKQNEVGPYVQRPDLRKDDRRGMPLAPEDVVCECGAVLRHSVPLFKVTSTGWLWQMIDKVDTGK